MKFLLLLLLFSCGKHQSPPPVDFADNDGDQVSNPKEGPLERNVAKVVELTEIKGNLSFSTKGGENFIVQLKNLQDNKKSAFELLTRNKKLINTDYYDEWSQLHLVIEKGLPAIEDVVTVNLNFLPDKNLITSLWFNDGKNKRMVATWSETIKVTLSSKELISLLKGEAHFHVLNRWMESDAEDVRKKTYRVFYFDGKAGKVIYVSKELEFSEFLKNNNIYNHQKLDNHDPFMDQLLLPENEWWSRDLDETKVIVKATRKQISEAFRQGFDKKQYLLRRSNGSPQGSIVINKPKEAKLYLTVRGSVSTREFGERSWKETYTEGGGGKEGSKFSWDCKYHLREEKAQTQSVLHPGTIDNLIRIMTKEGPKNLADGSIIELDESSGTLSFFIPEEVVEIIMLDGSKGPTVTTGLYQLSCDKGSPGPKRRISTTETLNEAKVEISVEAYVEKI